MKKKYISLIICLIFILSMCLATHSIAVAQVIDEEKVYCEIDENTDFADDTIMVVLTNKVSLSTKKYTVADFSEISCTEVTDLTEELWQQVINHQHSINCNPERETNAETFNRILKLKISDSGKSNVVAGIRKLEKRNDVKEAEPDYFVSLAASADDTYYQNNEQWGVDKINLPNAWDIETGSDNVLVGVIDTGIDNTHPDLVNRVNVTLSKDFADDLDGQYENNPFEDNVGHGTHVAGIIGAEGNNNTGVVGVCWNVSLVSLKISNESSGFKASTVAQAIQYAEVNNILILNLSLTFTSSTAKLKEAIENYTGLIVCAAGNTTTGGINIDYEGNNRFPACYTYNNVLTVGASTSSDEMAYFSNYGETSVDIFAPGYSILSTVPENLNSSGYMTKNGTSMATPFVAGVAALILSHNETLSAKDVKKIILDGGDHVDAFSGKCSTGGRLNAYKALANSHNFQYSVSRTTHTKYCSCGYSETTMHSYNYVWLNYTHHNATCVCGFLTMQPHAISLGLVKPGLESLCILCGGAVDAGFVKVESVNTLYITGKGSYVLPNGVIVLVDDDVVAYLNGTLTFISSNTQ